MSVVIAARNEEARIECALHSLCAQSGIRLDVVVVANCCTDGTVSTALRHTQAFAASSHRLRVIETELASKTSALNAGDQHLETFPRAYIDADVTLAKGALTEICNALQGETPRIAGGSVSLRSNGGGFAAAVATAMEVIPPFSDDVVGAGLYAVNASGRERWGAFPELIADDTFAVSHFEKSERTRVGTAAIIVRFPATTRLLPVLTRWEVGRQELRAKGVIAPRTSRIKVSRLLVHRPSLWGPVACLLIAKSLAKISARFSRPSAEWATADP